MHVQQRWYLDVYSYAACLGTEFPTNSYFSDDLSRLATAAAKMLDNTVCSGIDEIRISRTSEGQSPISIDESDVDIRHHDEEFVEGLL